jgi:predicted HD phosphohydrolase
VLVVAVVPVQSVDELVAFLAACDSVVDSLGPDGDPIDTLAHSLQCAHVLATRAPDDLELQVAGLVHDLGHVVDGGDPVDHGEIGGAYVRELLGPRVARLVELHVPAKRYLVTTDARYAGRLSGGSTFSLDLQGGGMNADEVAAFASDPCGNDATILRRADEAAKVIGRVVPDVGTWIPALGAVAAQTRSR